MFQVPYQILRISCPQVWHKAVLSQGTLVSQLDASWIPSLHFKLDIGLVFSQLRRFSNQLELKQETGAGCYKVKETIQCTLPGISPTELGRTYC